MYKTIFLDLSEAEKYAKNEVHTFFWDTLYLAEQFRQIVHYLAEHLNLTKNILFFL